MCARALSPFACSCLRLSRCKILGTLAPEQCVGDERRRGPTDLGAGSLRRPCGLVGVEGGYRASRVLLRKEVIQPHLPIRLPCYDFTPVISPTFDGSLPYGLVHRLRVLPTPMV